MRNCSHIMDELVNVTVAGAGAVDLTVAGGDKLKAVNATENTGGVTVDLSNASNAAFTGGAGADTLTVEGSTVAHTLGAGDDTVVVDDADFANLAKGFSVDGGDGVDTLAMSAARAQQMTAKIFKAFTNFEVLGLEGGQGNPIDLNNFGDINHVAILESLTTGESVINNMDSNGILEFNVDAGQGITVNVTDAGVAGHTTDVLNVKLSADGSVNANTLTVANVETINIEADDADDNGNAVHTLNLAAAAAKTVKVTGDADLVLSGDFAAGATIDISANTADVTFTAGVTDWPVDNENTLVKLEGFTAGDKINIAGAGNVAFGAKVELGANSTIQAYLAKAAQNSDTIKAAWFEFAGDTYIVYDKNDDGMGADDYIVKLAGTDYDLKGLSFVEGVLTLPEGA